jgi:type IV pilus assembly protein PilA
LGNAYIDSTRREPVHNRQHKEEVVKRKGFTLIELMVVIAIIIILAAIAIPNYLNMTQRAKRSRLASDFATVATVLETFKTDWGEYPVLAVAAAEDLTLNTTNIYHELIGKGISGTEPGGLRNSSSNTNAVGEIGPIEYLKEGTLTSIVNPFDTAHDIYYHSTGTAWVLYTDIGSGSTVNYLYRKDGMSSVSEVLTTAPTP